jgi:transposase
MKIHYIGADVHVHNTEICVESGKSVIHRYSVPTTIPAICEVLRSIPGKKKMAMEEGPMAGWLYRNLRDCVDEMIICDPKRNKYIFADGDIDDNIASAKLAQLLRGGYLRPVYHSLDEQRTELKQWVSLYRDRIRAGVRQINKIRAQCRMYGVTAPRCVICNPAARQTWLNRQRYPALARQLKVLWLGYDATREQAKRAKQQLIRLSKPYDIITYWKEIPGFGLIRAATLFAYLDTPWRFRKKTKLWRYCGMGIRHVGSGKDKQGRPRPAYLALDRQCNHVLKDIVMGAATSAIYTCRSNVFKCYYERQCNAGILAANARHSVARKILCVAWGMWKTMSRFNPSIAMSSIV